MREDFFRIAPMEENKMAIRLCEERCSKSYLTFEKIDFDHCDLLGEYRNCTFDGCDFTGAYLRAVFSNCNFTNCNLSKTRLQDSAFIDCTFDADVLYRFGEKLVSPLSGWKKCVDRKGKTVLVRLEIPRGAIVFCINGTKCRTDRVIVKEIIGADRAYSSYSYMSYYVGDEINVYNFDCRFNIECGTGIHFFKTKQEAEEYFIPAPDRARCFDLLVKAGCGDIMGWYPRHYELKYTVTTPTGFSDVPVDFNRCYIVNQDLLSKVEISQK